MGEIKQKVYDLARKFAATNQPFTVDDVAINFKNECSSAYIANRLHELSTGTFPTLRRLPNISTSLLDAEYISVKVKQPRKKKLNPGMDRETFHALYGCFGVSAVVKSGRYLINKGDANKIRLKVSSYINSHQPSRIELVAWLRDLMRNNRITTKQSIQIGVIHALQNNYTNPKDINGILKDSHLIEYNRARSLYDAELRDNAFYYRQDLTNALTKQPSARHTQTA